MDRESSLGLVGILRQHDGQSSFSVSDACRFEGFCKNGDAQMPHTDDNMLLDFVHHAGMEPDHICHI